ncbi:hypothetical protein B566_EDAN003567 [Ephemera danica]|nr:hypothetical protein B566_EDAN003567 [Ephemera danica]
MQLVACLVFVAALFVPHSSAIARSCTSPVTAAGNIHKEGCHEFPSKNGMHCFCSTNLCNTSLVLHPSRLLYTLLRYHGFDDLEEVKKTKKKVS